VAPDAGGKSNPQVDVEVMANLDSALTVAIAPA
jgi:hypothetical protein